MKKLINQLLSYTLIYSLLFPYSLIAQTIPEVEVGGSANFDDGIESASQNADEIKEKTKNDLMQLGVSEEDAKKSFNKAKLKVAEAKNAMLDFTEGTGSDFDSCTFRSNQDNWNIKSPSAKQAHAIYMGLWAAYNKEGKLGDSIFSAGGNGSSTFNLNEKLQKIGEKYKKSNDELIQKFKEADEHFTCHCNAIKAIGVSSLTNGENSQTGMNNYNANCGGVTENTDFTQITETEDSDAAAKKHKEMLISYLQTRKELLAQQIINYDDMFVNLNNLITSVQEQDYAALNEEETIKHGSENKEDVLYPVPWKRGVFVGEYRTERNSIAWGLINSGSKPKNYMGNIHLVSGSSLAQNSSLTDLAQEYADMIEECQQYGGGIAYIACMQQVQEQANAAVTFVNPDERKILFSNWKDAQHIADPNPDDEEVVSDQVSPIQYIPKYDREFENFIGLVSKDIDFYSIYFTPHFSRKCGDHIPNPSILTQKAKGFYPGHDYSYRLSGDSEGTLSPGNFCVNDLFKFKEEGIDQYLLDPPFPKGYNAPIGANVIEATKLLTTCIIEKNKSKLTNHSTPWFSGSPPGQVTLENRPHKKTNDDNINVLAPDVIYTCSKFDKYQSNPPFKAPELGESAKEQIKAAYAQSIKNTFPHVHESDLEKVADWVYKYHFIFPHQADALKVAYPAPGMSLWIGNMGKAMEIIGDDSLNSYENIDKILGAYKDDYKTNFGQGGTYYGDGEVVVNESTGKLARLPKITNIVTPGMANPGSVGDVGGQIDAGSRSAAGDFASAQARLKGAIKAARDLRDQKEKDFLERSKDKKRAKKVLDSLANFNNGFFSPLPARGGTLGGQSNFATGALATGKGGNNAIKNRGEGDGEEQKIGAYYNEGPRGSGNSGYGYSSGSSYSDSDSGSGSGTNSGLSRHSQQNILDNIDKQKHLYKSYDDDFLFIKVSKAYKRNLDRIFVRRKPKRSIKSPIDQKKAIKMDEEKRREISSILDD